MNPYPVSVSFDLDRAEDRAALTWLSQCRHKARRDGCSLVPTKARRNYSAAVIAVINDYRDRKERLSADPYLETREKEDAFLRRVLETIREGVTESGNLGLLLRLLQGSQTNTEGGSQSQGKDSQSNTEDLESISAALDFVDAL